MFRLVAWKNAHYARVYIILQTAGHYALFPLLTNLQVNAETVARRCSVKKVFLEISQNSQENTSTRVSFLTKLAKFLRVPFFIEHLRWMLL